mgnify:CR=1 FL=1
MGRPLFEHETGAPFAEALEQGVVARVAVEGNGEARGATPDPQDFDLRGKRGYRIRASLRSCCAPVPDCHRGGGVVLGLGRRLSGPPDRGLYLSSCPLRGALADLLRHPLQGLPLVPIEPDVESCRPSLHKTP